MVGCATLCGHGEGEDMQERDLGFLVLVLQEKIKEGSALLNNTLSELGLWKGKAFI